ncbi:MAG: fimbrillin family protein, partial [Candidatus Cryptobacteroides sp.]
PDLGHITLLVQDDELYTKAGECEQNTFQIELPENITIPVSIIQEPATKAAPVNNSDNTLSKIWLWADLVETGQEYIVGQKISKSADEWKTNRFWPHDKALSFLACSSSASELDFSPAITTTSTGEINCQFTYEVKKGSGELEGKDAQAQEDVLLGMSLNKTNATGTVTMEMHHALSAIKFKVGRVPDGVILKGISLTNVYGKANCSVSGDASVLNFNWSGHCEVRSYTQTYGQTLTTGDAIGGKEQTFIIIPQEFTTEDAQLQLELTIQGRTYILKKALKDIVPSFDAERIYTFTIGTADEMDVEITDHVDGAVKSGVEIKNAGFSTAYVRIAIIGYWKDASGTIVIPWTEGEGEFEGWSSKWVQQSDGFYYYTEQLPGHSIAEPPFQKYTLKVMKQEGLKLYFNICVQVIHPSQIDLWPNHPTSW